MKRRLTAGLIVLHATRAIAAAAQTVRNATQRELTAKLGTVGAISYVNVNGHTDRIGSAQFNQKLSERRANVVKSYLVSKGMDASKMGKAHDCKGKNGCKGQGGCKSGDAGCAGKNSCKGKGGCKAGDNGCKGKNSCKGKGGCATTPKPAEALNKREELSVVELQQILGLGQSRISMHLGQLREAGLVQDRRAADGDEIRAMLEAPARSRRIHDLAGHADPHVAAVQVHEPVDQRLRLEPVLVRFLEHVPQRQVDEVEPAVMQQALHDFPHLAEQQSEALRRNADAEREVRAAAGADASDDLVDEAEPILERTAVAISATVVERRQELDWQVGVRSVHIHDVEPDVACTLRRPDSTPRTRTLCGPSER